MTDEENGRQSTEPEAERQLKLNEWQYERYEWGCRDVQATLIRARMSHSLPPMNLSLKRA
jgi:hypothetical protein